jgi:hypothetical protein
MGGCEKPLDEAIIGKWEVEFQKTQAFIGETMMAQEIDTMEANERVIEILEDGTGNTYTYGNLEDTFTWVLDGTMTTVTITGDTPEIMEFETSIKKNTLTLEMTILEIGTKADYDKYKMIIIAHRI